MRRLTLLAIGLLALLGATSIASANHSVFERVSDGEIGSNGVYDATLRGVSDDGARVFFTTAEAIAAGDKDNRIDLYQRFGGMTTLISRGQINGNGAFDVSFRRASADGTHVFFETDEQLVANDTDSSPDIYERSGATTKRVSAGQINGNGAFSPSLVGVSSDGTRVFFQTSERLVASDTDDEIDIYERSGGTTKLVSAGQINGNGSFSATPAGTSADGTRVFFQTFEPLAANDTDASFDLYERSGGITTLVSAGQINGDGAFTAAFRGASDDGTQVFFDTDEPLVDTDTDTVSDLYERSGGTTKRVSAGQVNGNGPTAVFSAGNSATGNRVFFFTVEPLVAGDTDSSYDVYERSGGTTKRVSTGQINGSGAFPAFIAGFSDDGTRVFFYTDEPLVANDTDTSQDVYERSGGTTKRVSAGQVNGNGAFPATFARASASGTRVFFTTAESLVNNDSDINSDIYERFAGATTRISNGQVNGNGLNDATFAGASADGTDVFFHTFESLEPTDLDAQQDVYSASVP